MKLKQKYQELQFPMGSDNVHLYNRNKHVYSLVQKKKSNFMLMTTIWMNFYRTHLNHTKAFQLNSELFRMAAEPDYILTFAGE